MVAYRGESVAGHRTGPDGGIATRKSQSTIELMHEIANERIPGAPSSGVVNS
jgi:hypothetical protein